jgi:hypothetical protein
MAVADARKNTLGMRERMTKVREIVGPRGSSVKCKQEEHVYVKNEGKREKHLWNTPIHLD